MLPVLFLLALQFHTMVCVGGFFLGGGGWQYDGWKKSFFQLRAFVTMGGGLVGAKITPQR